MVYMGKQSEAAAAEKTEREAAVLWVKSSTRRTRVADWLPRGCCGPAPLGRWSGQRCGVTADRSWSASWSASCFGPRCCSRTSPRGDAYFAGDTRDDAEQGLSLILSLYSLAYMYQRSPSVQFTSTFHCGTCTHHISANSLGTCVLHDSPPRVGLTGRWVDLPNVCIFILFFHN